MKPIFPERSSQVRNTVTRARKKLHKDPSFSICGTHPLKAPRLSRLLKTSLPSITTAGKTRTLSTFILLCRSAADMGWLRLWHSQAWMVRQSQHSCGWFLPGAPHTLRQPTVKSMRNVLLGPGYRTPDATRNRLVSSVRTIDYLIGDDNKNATGRRCDANGVALSLLTDRTFEVWRLRQNTPPGRQLKRIRTNRPSG